MITFRVSDAAGGGPCSSGFGLAVRLFDQQREYSVAEMLAAGLAPEHVEWIIFHKARGNPDVLAGVRAWAALLYAELGPDASIDDAISILRRAWASAVKDLIRSGLSQARATRRATARYHEAMAQAFA